MNAKKEPPKRIKNQCDGCEKRRVGCHSECEAYIKYREALDKYNDYVTGLNKQRQAIFEHQQNSVLKSLKRSGKKK